VIIIDSMDKKKCVWPKYSFMRKPHEIEGLKPRPRMTLTCGIAHGWVTGLFVGQEGLTHGSDAFLEVLCLLLTKVSDMCKAAGRRFPAHLVVQADNTVAQTKNSFVSSFLSYVVGQSKFSTATMNFLMVGHTHEDVDQMFGLVTELLVRKHKWETPEEFERLLLVEMGPLIIAKGEAVLVQSLRSIRDFTAWLAPLKVKLYGCWGTRDGIEAPHSFVFKRRSDLSYSERSQEHCTLAAIRAGLGSAESSPDDVLCCVKTYMRDKRLQQPPLNVLPVSRRDRVTGDWPVEVQPVMIDVGRANQLYAMANVLEKDLYGYTRAARALRDLATSVAGPAQPPGWLAEPPPQQAPITYSANEYFGHLPDVSWQLRAGFANI
jgi:hypothetical protein